MEAKYGSDIRPDEFSPVEASYLEFFRIDRNGKKKGIGRLTLAEVEP